MTSGFASEENVPEVKFYMVYIMENTIKINLEVWKMTTEPYHGSNIYYFVHV